MFRVNAKSNHEIIDNKNIHLIMEARRMPKRMPGKSMLKMGVIVIISTN